MFDDDCFIFLKFDFHVVEFDRVCSVKAFAFFDYNVNCFDNFIFFDDEIIVDKNQCVINLKIDQIKWFDVMK